MIPIVGHLYNRKGEGMAKKLGPRKQPSAIKCIKVIAQTHGYKVQTRKKDSKVSPEEKKFLPDVVAQPEK